MKKDTLKFNREVVKWGDEELFPASLSISHTNTVKCEYHGTLYVFATAIFIVASLLISNLTPKIIFNPKTL